MSTTSRGDRSGAVPPSMLTDQWYVRVQTTRRARDFVPLSKVACGSFPTTTRTLTFYGRTTSRTGGSRQPAGGVTLIPGVVRRRRAEIYVARDEQEVRSKYGLGPDIASEPGSKCTGHLVLVCALSAVLDARRARADACARDVYRTSVLVTSWDIIFFLGRSDDHDGSKIHARKGVPRRVIQYALVRDHEGQEDVEGQGEPSWIRST